MELQIPLRDLLVPRAHWGGRFPGAQFADLISGHYCQNERHGGWRRCGGPRPQWEAGGFNHWGVGYVLVVHSIENPQARMRSITRSIETDTILVTRLHRPTPRAPHPQQQPRLDPPASRQATPPACLPSPRTPPRLRLRIQLPPSRRIPPTVPPPNLRPPPQPHNQRTAKLRLRLQLRRRNPLLTRRRSLQTAQPHPLRQRRPRSLPPRLQSLHRTEHRHCLQPLPPTLSGIRLPHRKTPHQASALETRGRGVALPS